MKTDHHTEEDIMIPRMVVVLLVVDCGRDGSGNFDSSTAIKPMPQFWYLAHKETNTLPIQVRIKIVTTCI
jgi:hypothetical protein